MKLKIRKSILLKVVDGLTMRFIWLKLILIM